MKKILLFFNVFNLVIISTINLISCVCFSNKIKILDIENNNYIIDLEKKYEILEIDLSNNSGNIPFNKKIKLTPFLEQINKNNVNYNTIRTLSNGFFSKASSKNYDKFNNFISLNNLKTHEELFRKLNNCNKNFIDNFIQEIKKFNDDNEVIESIKNSFLLIYNSLWKIYKTDIVCKIIDNISLVDIIDNDESILGKTRYYNNFSNKNQKLFIKKEIYKKENIGFTIPMFFWYIKIKKINNTLISKISFLNWIYAFNASPFLNQTIFHEFGHVVHNIFYYWYHINIIESLKKFIIQKVKNLEKLKINNNDLIYKSFSVSKYGLSSDYEWFAECFTYWLLTPEKWRTKAWEILNEFFTSINNF